MPDRAGRGVFHHHAQRRQLLSQGVGRDPVLGVSGRLPLRDQVLDGGVAVGGLLDDLNR